MQSMHYFCASWLFMSYHRLNPSHRTHRTAPLASICNQCCPPQLIIVCLYLNLSGRRCCHRPVDRAAHPRGNPGSPQAPGPDRPRTTHRHQLTRVPGGLFGQHRLQRADCRRGAKATRHRAQQHCSLPDVRDTGRPRGCDRGDE